MEVLSLLKFWRNRAPEVTENKESFELAVTYPQCDFEKEVTEKNKSSIVISTNVGITSFDNDTNKQCVHKQLSKIDGQAAQANANAFNANVFTFQKLQKNYKSQSPVLVLRSSQKLRVSMLRFKKSSSLDESEVNCITSMASPKREQSSFESMREKSEDSSSNKYMKLIKQASKIRIFDQSADGEKRQQGGRAAVFREVCKSLMKSKSSVRTVPVPVSRRDDSALQQQDGIQSAILHCKRSYSSSSSSSSSFSTISQECTVLLSRSASESSHQKAAINPKITSSVEGEMK